MSHLSVSFRNMPSQPPLVLEVSPAPIYFSVGDAKRAICAALGVLPKHQRIAMLDAPNCELTNASKIHSAYLSLVVTDTLALQLGQRLPHIGVLSRMLLAKDLKGLSPTEFNLASIQEKIDHRVIEQATALRSLLHIIHIESGESIQKVTCEGEALLPFRLLTDGSGIELRCPFSYIYRAASPEYVAEVAEARERRPSNIAYCKQLLSELSSVYVKIKAALEAHCVFDDASELEHRVMVMDRNRIQGEGHTLQHKCRLMESAPLPQLDQAKFTTYGSQVSQVMKFGVPIRISGQIYQAVLLSAGHPRMPVATPVAINTTPKK